MPAATKTITDLTALPITQQSFYDALKAALVSAGFSATPFDEFVPTSNSKIAVYEVIGDDTKAKSKTYFSVYLTSNLILGTQLFATWDKVAHTGTGNQPEFLGSSAGVGFGTSIVMQFTALNHTEFRGVCVKQGGTFNIIGSTRPASKPEWFDENRFPYAFALRDSSFYRLNGFGGADQPFGAGDANPAHYGDRPVYTLGPWVAKLGYENTFTLKRDIIPGPYVFFPTNSFSDEVGRGIAGKYSDDLVLVAGAGLLHMDVIRITPTEEYTVFQPGAPCMAIRTL